MIFNEFSQLGSESDKDRERFAKIAETSPTEIELVYNQVGPNGHKVDLLDPIVTGEIIHAAIPLAKAGAKAAREDLVLPTRIMDMSSHQVISVVHYAGVQLDIQEAQKDSVPAAN